jgi:hypothetical protein
LQLLHNQLELLEIPNENGKPIHLEMYHSDLLKESME